MRQHFTLLKTLVSYSTLAGVLLGGLFLAVVSHAGPKYIDFDPLNNAVSKKIESVDTSGATQVPIITWGGDIALIHANGGSTSTQAGSIVRNMGLNLKLVREDIFRQQLENYISGKSPYLRGTMGMINAAAELLNKDSRTAPVVIHQLTWSAGGDALVVKPGIGTAKDLKGKRIAIQAYGPHVDYASRILKDAGLSFNDVKIKWLPDLTGTDNSPMAALYEKDIDAAFVIIPDALALTSGGQVGTGSEQSVKGAKILLSTKTANRVIADVFAVRSDYLSSNRKQVEAFVAALFKGQESLNNLVRDKQKNNKEYKRLFRASAKILLDSEEALSDAEGLFADAEITPYADNVKFFTDQNYPRRFSKLVSEVQQGLKDIKALSSSASIKHANWNYGDLRQGLILTAESSKPKFNEAEVASLVTRKQQQNSLQEGELFSFEVFFKPNQNSFSTDYYQQDFQRVVELASTYGGAIITVEGHSDVMGYLRSLKRGDPPVVLGRIKQSAKNLSLTRAQAVRDAILSFASGKSVSMDPSQFALVGHGISSPKNGMCGDVPCAPKTEQQWRANMRVEFRIIQVEAESEVFQPL